MKKYSLTLILVLCLFVITGGTYAAWTYYESKVGNGTGAIGSATIGEVKVESKGNLAVSGNESVTITISDDGSYNTVIEVKNDITVTFNGSGSIADTSFTWGLTVAEGTNSYLENPIFTLTTGNELTFSGNTTGSTATITADQIKTALGYHSVNLPKSTDFTAYKALVEGISFTLTVVDTTVYPA